MFELKGTLVEKKVEYIELIYDLIFVYLISRTSALLHITEGGFFTGGMYLAYSFSTLVIFQIWLNTTVLINRYGSNGVADHIGLFVNMYLLYYMADGIRMDWGDYYLRYNIAWGLILVNLMVQYLLHLRKCRCDAAECRHIRSHVILLIILAAVILVSVPVYLCFHIPLSWAALPLGFLLTLFTAKVDVLTPVNFEHLTERVMLYVVFVFGEMIVSIAGYFESGFAPISIYYSLMAFLIVAGMFLCYGLLYNRVIDRVRTTTGLGYMMLHLVLLFALGNITVALELMPELEVSLQAKNAYLVISFLVYFFFLFLLERYSKNGYRAGARTFAFLAVCAVIFAVLIAMLYENGPVSIAISVLFVYAVFFLIVRHARAVSRAQAEEESESES